VSEPGALSGAPAMPPARQELQDQVMRAVRRRFALAAHAFVTRVYELAVSQCGASDAALRDYVMKLSLDDLYLATACLGGEEAAWRELSGLHFEFMRGFARRFVSGQAARDVADEVISELWSRRKLEQYGGRSTLRTWLGTVVAHAALNSRHALQRTVSLHADNIRSAERSIPTTDRSQPADDQAALLLRELLTEAVAGLATEERLLLRLYYEQGMTLDELSRMLGISGAAISRRLKGAREEVRARVESGARTRTGESADALRAGLDLSRIELDLDKLLRADLSKPDAQEL
jgi:RNA polymerase sigma-70 factor (ECF subfamily)